MGMRVIGVDGDDDKAALCTSLGAEAFFDFTKEKDIPARVMELTTYGAHAVLVFAATKQAYSSAPEYLRVGGAVIAVGLPKDTSAIAGASPLVVAAKRLRCVKRVDTQMIELTGFQDRRLCHRHVEGGRRSPGFHGTRAGAPHSDKGHAGGRGQILHADERGKASGESRSQSRIVTA